ncbi:MAG: Ribose-phosphate pyrophosphokinase, partial [uncultured Lysobacter sp.]
GHAKRSQQPSGVQRQREPAARRSRVQGTRHPPRQGAGRQVLRRRSAGRDRGERAPAGGVRHPADERADRRELHGAAGARRRAQARLGHQRHRGGAVLRLRPPGPPPAFVARADYRQGRREDVQRGGRRPRAPDRPARRPDPGLF